MIASSCTLTQDKKKIYQSRFDIFRLSEFCFFDDEDDDYTDKADDYTDKADDGDDEDGDKDDDDYDYIYLLIY